jgi:hypothetical protein
MFCIVPVASDLMSLASGGFVIDYAIQHTHLFVRTVAHNGTLHIRTSQIHHTTIFRTTYDHSNFNIHSVYADSLSLMLLYLN